MAEHNGATSVFLTIVSPKKRKTTLFSGTGECFRTGERTEPLAFVYITDFACHITRDESHETELVGNSRPAGNADKRVLIHCPRRGSGIPSTTLREERRGLVTDQDP